MDARTLRPRVSHCSHRRRASSDSLGDTLTRASQACITQSKIDEQLGSLPIFIAGCKLLVVFAGPSYLERLWVRADRARLQHTRAVARSGVAPSQASLSPRPRCPYACALAARSCSRPRCAPSSCSLVRSASSNSSASGAWEAPRSAFASYPCRTCPSH